MSAVNDVDAARSLFSVRPFGFSSAVCGTIAVTLYGEPPFDASSAAKYWPATSVTRLAVSTVETEEGLNTVGPTNASGCTVNVTLRTSGARPASSAVDARTSAFGAMSAADGRDQLQPVLSKWSYATARQ